MQNDTETLAFAILKCVQDNDLDELRTLLTHPLACEAVGFETIPWETPGCLITACREDKIDFVVALLPYCDVDDVAYVLTQCLTSGNVNMCEVIVGHCKEIAQHLDPDTLSMLAGIYHQLLEHPMGFKPTRQRAALQWFLNWAPKEIVQQQLHGMTGAAFNLVEDMVAEQQKQRLEQEVGGEGRVGAGWRM